MNPIERLLHWLILTASGLVYLASGLGVLTAIILGVRHHWERVRRWIRTSTLLSLVLVDFATTVVINNREWDWFGLAVAGLFVSTVIAIEFHKRIVTPIRGELEEFRRMVSWQVIPKLDALIKQHEELHPTIEHIAKKIDEVKP